MLYLNYRAIQQTGVDGRAKGTVVGALGGGYNASEAASTGKGKHIMELREAWWRHLD